MGCGGSKKAAEEQGVDAEPSKSVRKTVVMRWTQWVGSGKDNANLRQSDLDWANAITEGGDGGDGGDGGKGDGKPVQDL
jgi:hypothetical protein